MDDEVEDNTCDVCGESCIDRDHISLTAWGVWTAKGDGIAHFPEDVEFVEDWPSLVPLRLLHKECIANFFDGDLISMPFRRKAGK